MQAELEIRHHAEVAAAAAHAPEQLGILAGAGMPEFSVRADHIDRLEVVDGHAEATRDSAEAAAQGQAADARVRHRSQRSDQALRHALEVHLSQQRAAGNRGTPRRRIDSHAAKSRQVDLHAAIAGRLTRMAVATAFHGHEQVVSARESHGRLHVLGVAGLSNEGRVLVEGRIEYLARLVIALVAGQQQRSSHLRGELADLGGAQGDFPAFAGDGNHVGHLAGGRHGVGRTDHGNGRGRGQQR